MSDDHFVRKCNGGPSHAWCGKPATVVCSVKDDAHIGRMEQETGLDLSSFGAFEWFACDDPAHQEGTTEPLKHWLARNGLFDN